MNKRNRILTVIFILIAVIELVGRLLDDIRLEYPVKPLIMIWITLYFLLNAKKRSFIPGVMIAFFFSWTGDILLMLSGGYDNEIFFFAGVGSFFVAQVAYIFIFLLSKENDIKGLLLRNPLWLLPFLGFGAGIYLLLLPELEGVMKPMILVYAIALISMSLAALNRRDRVDFQSFQFVFAGSLLFVLSDSLIAINKFYMEIPFAGFLIMLSYIAAQYLIMRGLILEKERPASVQESS